jgi:hypothetical protein
MTRSQATVFSPGPVATFIKETMRMTPGMGSGRCTGPMAAIIRANGRMVYSMAEVMIMFNDKVKFLYPEMG